MSEIGEKYAQALYSLAKEVSAQAQILSELCSLNTAFCEEPEFLRLLSAHGLSKQERCGIIDDSFRDRVHPYLLNFMKVLTEKGYVRHFGDCVKAYTQLYNDDHNIVRVHAVTAVPLSGQQEDKLRMKLEKVTGKTVQLHTSVDAACLGGVRLDYDGKRVDGTVKNRLDSIGALLKNTVL